MPTVLQHILPTSISSETGTLSAASSCHSTKRRQTKRRTGKEGQKENVIAQLYHLLHNTHIIVPSAADVLDLRIGDLIPIRVHNSQKSGNVEPLAAPPTNSTSKREEGNESQTKNGCEQSSAAVVEEDDNGTAGAKNDPSIEAEPCSQLIRTEKAKRPFRSLMAGGIKRKPVSRPSSEQQQHKFASDTQPMGGPCVNDNGRGSQEAPGITLETKPCEAAASRGTSEGDDNGGMRESDVMAGLMLVVGAGVSLAALFTGAATVLGFDRATVLVVALWVFAKRARAVLALECL